MNIVSWGLRQGCFVVLLLFGLPLVSQATETISTGDLYPPYVDRTLPENGLMVPIIKHIFNRTEDYYDIEMVYEPWVRGYEQTKQGVHLGTFPYVWDKERDQDFYYSDPVFDVGSYLFVRDEVDEDEWSVELLKEKNWTRVCRPNGYSIEELKEPLLSLMDFTVYSPSDLPDCFRLLEKGRMDIVPIEKSTGEFTLFNHLRGLKVKVFKNSVFKAGLYFIVSKQRKDGEEIIRQFNEAMKKTRESGEFEQWVKDFYDRLAVERQ